MASAAVLAAGAGAASPSGQRTGAAAAARSCLVPAHLASGHIVVPIVVDFGGSTATVLVTCVVTTPGSTGAQVLAAQAQLTGDVPPRYALSGLLSAIDGWPTTGCGQQSGGHYAYWSYFHGGRRWVYSSGGPGSFKVSAGDVEGWRFQPDGSGGPGDPPPRAPSAAASLLRSAAPGTTTTTTAAPSTSAPPATSPPVPTVTAAPTTTVSTTTTTLAREARTPGSSTSTSTTAADQRTVASQGPGSGGGSKDAAGPVHDPSGGTGTGTGGDLALALGLSAIALLAGGAVARSRRMRRRDEAA